MKILQSKYNYFKFPQIILSAKNFSRSGLENILFLSPMRKLIKILSAILLGLLIIILLLFIFDYDYLLKGINSIYLKGHTTAYIDDHKEFENRVIEAGENHQPWPLHSDYNIASQTSRLKDLNREIETVAYLIIKNDSIWYEDYAEGYNQNSLTNSFSMAKSITTALMGRAIKENHIKGLDQPVTDFFPNFKSSFDSPLTVGDLASMSSGLNWDEDYYNPFSVTARVYFDDDIREVVHDLEVIKEPGQEFEYLSGNTLLLGMVVKKLPAPRFLNILAKISGNQWECKMMLFGNWIAGKAEWKKPTAALPPMPVISPVLESCSKITETGMENKYWILLLLRQPPGQNLKILRNMVMAYG